MIHLHGVKNPAPEFVFLNSGIVPFKTKRADFNNGAIIQPKASGKEKPGFFSWLIESAKQGSPGKALLNSIAITGTLADGVVKLLLNTDIGFTQKIETLHNQFLFQPNHTDYFAPPDKKKVTFEEVFIPVPDLNDEVKLHGYYFPAPNAESTLIYLHGYNGSADEYYPDCLKIQEHIPTNILLVDYRGFGNSSGNPTRQGVITDALSMHKFLEEKKGLAGKNIFLYGVSLGGAVAFELQAD